MYSIVHRCQAEYAGDPGETVRLVLEIVVSGEIQAVNEMKLR
jgi:hypothetical protein